MLFCNYRTSQEGNCKHTSGDTIGRVKLGASKSQEKRECIRAKSPWTKPYWSLSSYGQIYNRKNKGQSWHYQPKIKNIKLKEKNTMMQHFRY